MARQSLAQSSAAVGRDFPLSPFLGCFWNNQPDRAISPGT